MKIELLYAKLKLQNLAKYRYTDKSSFREQYLFNVIKAISCIEEKLFNYGYEDMFVSQSPFSCSCYFTMNIFNGKNIVTSITLRISDHQNPNFDQCLADEIISENGDFNLNLNTLKLLEKCEESLFKL